MMQGQNQGLAAQGHQQQRAMLDQVKELLLQGISPEDLIAQGVPQEIIEQAIMELQQEMDGQQPEAQPATPAGQGMVG